MNTQRFHKQAGQVGASVIFGGLLAFGIFCQVLYLTSGTIARVDVTSEKLYTLSGSTKRILEKLEQPLTLEAYFSKDVPGQYKTDRQDLEDVLIEYDAIGGDNVRLIFFDPLEDESIKEKASRLGITETEANELKEDSLRTVRFFQGLRIRYGGDKQKVLPLVQGASALESQITPAIQELVTKEKPKVGILKRAPAPANPYMRQQQPPDFTYLERVIRGRCEIVNVDMSKGQVLPEDLRVLVVVAPKDLTDWEKYQIDQHLMRGGSMIVFQEAADYGASQFTMFYRENFNVDTPDSKLTWKQQLDAYGLDWSNKLVADMFQQAWVPGFQASPGQRALSTFGTPYWFQAVPLDWSSVASQLSDDAAVVKNLREELKHGIDPKHPVFEGSRGIMFFWPTEVALKKELPTGVTGKILVRGSPFSLTEEPPQSTDPKTQNANLFARRSNENRRQSGLIAVLRGKFPSAFKGKDLPKRPLPKDDKKGGLWSQGEGKQGAGSQESKAASQGGEKNAETQKPETQKPDPSKVDTTPKSGDAGKKVNAAPKPQTPGQGEGKPAGQGEAAGPGQGPIGPQPQKEEEKDKLPPRIDQAQKEGRILFVGDANLVRDDFLTGQPWFRMQRAQGGLELFQNAVDWLALGTDLIELRNKRDVDRSMSFVADDATNTLSPEERKEQIASKKAFLKVLNIGLPVVLILAIGLIMWIKRRSEKSAFLASVGR